MASTAHPEDPDPEQGEGEGDEGSKDEETKRILLHFNQ